MKLKSNQGTHTETKRDQTNEVMYLTSLEA